MSNDPFYLPEPPVFEPVDPRRATANDTFRQRRGPRFAPEPVPGLQEFPGVIPPRLMDMLTAFCVGVTESRLPNQEIGRANSPYIDRWFLARKAQVPTFVYDEIDPRQYARGVPSELENVYLHRYHRGDADVPHDHPWPNVSLVVRGYYIEAIHDERGHEIRRETRRPGDIVLRSAGSIHAIVATSDDCLSLFATLRKEREWGFWRDGEFIHWKDFHGAA
jgi:hypothetical protein